ncbi:hypothetical protein TNCV_5106571 [Trichonephila clavipes]|nr:hypothetical protein TNCV_5106571 [Trichonephila clavipes]
MALLVQTARECFCVLHKNRTREATKDRLCGLPIRRDEGRVVDPPLVFKKRFLQMERTRDREDLMRALKKGGPRLGWKGRRYYERRWRWRIGVI